MKNILYLHAGAETYGADNVLYELLRNIDKTCINPIVILPCNGPLVDKLRSINIFVRVIEYPILRRKYFNIKGIVNYFREYYKRAKEILEFLSKNNIDIDLLHINTTAVLEGIYLKKKLKVPMIWHIHEIIVRPKFLSIILNSIVTKKADVVVTVSNAVKNHIEKIVLGKTKSYIEVIYNGVDSDKYNPKVETKYIRQEFNIPEDAVIVGMIGRVNAWKGQKDFLKAIEIILQQNDNVYGVLVGGVFDGEEWRIDELKKIINGIKGKDRIIFSDFRIDTPSVHNLFDIFVLPSTSPDPLPTVILESMSTGKPIVAYRHGGVCEMVKENHNGIFAVVNDYNSLAEKILFLINNKKLRDEFSINSRNRAVKKFSIKSYVNNFSILYKNLLNGGNNNA